MPFNLLSKSKYIAGLQCPKLLWVQINDPRSIPEPDLETQYIFDQGHRVGELATKLFPGGIYLDTDDFMENIRLTEFSLGKRMPLFEAGILADRIYCRIDILNPTGRDEWDIIEVKSSTSVKEVHIHDVSFQKLCCKKAGLKIRKCKLVHVNNQYIKSGEISPVEFFTVEDISSQVADVSEGIEDRVAAMLAVISSDTCPQAGIGRNCFDPYDCGLLDQCWAFLPENSIFDLRGGKTRQFSLYEQGILCIKDIPDDIRLSKQQQIQKECVLTGNTHVEKEEIRQFLDTLVYPLHYLDFETISPAIPLYDGTRPYQLIPFQFSLHVVGKDNCEPLHYAFLTEGTGDPRPELLSELHRLIGNEGSVVAYNSGFETSVLNGLIEACPEYKEWYAGIFGQIVDLLKPFSNFHYYDASQKDTASLKKVLPAVTGRGYDNLNINDGTIASILYEQVTYGNATEDERAKVRANLLEYCRQDTEGMIWIVERLRELSI
ncbi:DUF2779 domain-containing protein [Chloroflexota bacterium]